MTAVGFIRDYASEVRWFVRLSKATRGTDPQYCSIEACYANGRTKWVDGNKLSIDITSDADRKDLVMRLSSWAESHKKEADWQIDKQGRTRASFRDYYPTDEQLATCRRHKQGKFTPEELAAVKPCKFKWKSPKEIDAWAEANL